MGQHEFDRGTAEAMIAMTAFPDAVVVKDDGVFVANDFRICSPTEQAFDWTPAYDMDWPEAPNPITAPALPIPFTAGELAAFMLDGIGAGLPERLDRRIGYSLDDVALERFGKRERLVREALRSAYVLAERAQSVVGEYDFEEQRRAYDLLKQLDDANGHANEHEGVFAQGITDAEASQRRARAKASVADLEARALRAKAEVDAKWTAWRAAMVRQLLQSQPVPIPAPAPVEALARPVVAVSAAGVVVKVPPAPATGPVYSMRRDAMIKAHESEWPSIVRDMKDASENGLSVAKAGARAWKEADALDWARSKGKLNSAPKSADALTNGINNMARLPGVRHKI